MLEEKQASNAPRVSIVMAMYNPGDALEETLRRISSQTWRDYEIVVVMDCDERVTPEPAERIGTILAQPDIRPGDPVLRRTFLGKREIRGMSGRDRGCGFGKRQRGTRHRAGLHAWGVGGSCAESMPSLSNVKRFLSAG